MARISRTKNRRCSTKEESSTERVGKQSLQQVTCEASLYPMGKRDDGASSAILSYEKFETPRSGQVHHFTD